MPAAPAPLIRRLRELRDETLPLFDLPERRLAGRYRRGGWTARELLVHIADAESVLLDRLRRIAAEDKPLLTAFDQDAWVARLAYRRRDLGVARALFLAARSTIAEQLQLQDRAAAARQGVHTEAGLLSLAEVAEKVVGHHAHHLAQLRRALG